LSALFDLHSHSTYSDGTLTPDALIARAAERKVGVLALTDHDDTGGLAEALSASERFSLQLIQGVEISVSWRGHTIHIVGLDIDPDNAVLRAGLAKTRAGRLSRAEKIVAALDAVGIAGSAEGARLYASNPHMIGRTHFARFLVAQGVVKNISAAFKRFLGGGRACYVSHQWANLDDAVAWIKASGGIAVIAHPGRYPLDSAELREFLTEFRDAGGAALEIVSSSHNPAQFAKFAGYAQEFGLMASTGSDFHSPAESYHDLGSLPALPAGCRPVWDAFRTRICAN
jgi:3',5'-nucleoside bisphosphate phosphatase